MSPKPNPQHPSPTSFRPASHARSCVRLVTVALALAGSGAPLVGCGSAASAGDQTDSGADDGSLTPMSGDGGTDTGAPPCSRAPGTICTIAGTGIAGDGDDLLPALATRLYLPQDVTVAPDGRVFIVDWNNHRIRMLQADGTLRVVAGVGELGAAADDPSTGRLNHPTGVAFNPAWPPNLMVIAAWHNSRVLTVDLDRPVEDNVVEICGNGMRGFGGNGGPASAATLDLPVAVAFTAAGDLLIADQANQMVRKVDHVSSTIETLAGVGRCADSINPAPCVFTDDVPALQAGFHFPVGQAANPGGRIALDAAGDIYVADTENFRVRRIGVDGMVHTIAGNGTWGYAGDGGPGSEAQLGRLSDVAVGPDGVVYIADTDNSCVRMVTPDGIISTFAGQCTQRGFAGDDGPPAAALLDRPTGVEVTPAGDVYIADTHNNRVRVVFH